MARSNGRRSSCGLRRCDKDPPPARRRIAAPFVAFGAEPPGVRCDRERDPAHAAIREAGSMKKYPEEFIGTFFLVLTIGLAPC